jgi:hypothetical protein
MISLKCRHRLVLRCLMSGKEMAYQTSAAPATPKRAHIKAMYKAHMRVSVPPS